MVTIKDLYNLAHANSEPLFGSGMAVFPFMSQYVENSAYFDRNIVINRGFFSPIWNEEDEESTEEILTAFRFDVAGLLKKNEENYTRLYNLMSIDYEPLNNYDMTSVVTDQQSGEDTETTVNGERVTTDVLGEAVSTDENGEQTSTDTDGLAGFNSTDFSDSEQSVSVDNTYTDTHTDEEHTNKRTEDEATDTKTTEYGHLLTHNERKYGNLGVTTSQQMAESEKNLWTSFKFFDIIVNDIIKELCTFSDNGYECF